MDYVGTFATVLCTILNIMGAFLIWSGVYSFIKARTRPAGHEDDDVPWWKVGLGLFLVVSGTSSFIPNLLSSLQF